MDAKIYRPKPDDDASYVGDVRMNRYELLSELKDVDKQDNYKEAYDEIKGPLDCLYSIVPLYATDVIVLTNTTWEGTYFCNTFGYLVLDGNKFDIESDDFVSSIVIRHML